MWVVQDYVTTLKLEMHDANHKASTDVARILDSVKQSGLYQQYVQVRL